MGTAPTHFISPAGYYVPAGSPAESITLRQRGYKPAPEVTIDVDTALAQREFTFADPDSSEVDRRRVDYEYQRAVENAAAATGTDAPADRVAAAAQDLADAQSGGDEAAVVDAAQKVTDAQTAVTAAQRTSRRAQTRLGDARKDATEQIGGLNEALAADESTK